MGSEQQRQHSAGPGLVDQVFPERSDSEGRNGVGVVHASFFAMKGVSDAVRRPRNVSDRLA